MFLSDGRAQASHLSAGHSHRPSDQYYALDDSAASRPRLGCCRSLVGQASSGDGSARTMVPQAGVGQHWLVLYHPATLFSGVWRRRFMYEASVVGLFGKCAASTMCMSVLWQSAWLNVRRDRAALGLVRLLFSHMLLLLPLLIMSVGQSLNGGARRRLPTKERARLQCPLLLHGHGRPTGRSPQS